MGQCPPDLVAQLAANGLCPDEATACDGNCGVDAFARSWMRQQSGTRARAYAQARHLQKAADKVSLLRRVGVEWLEAHARESIWDGMTVAHLCEIVSGTIFLDYVAKMRNNREWIDTAFLHALGCAYGVNVLIFQPHMEPAMVGISLTESVQEDSKAPTMVPVALLNDIHFWGVMDCTPPPHIDPVDKGEIPVFRACMGLYPSTGTKDAGQQAQQEGAEGDEDGEEPDGVFPGTDRPSADRPSDASPETLDAEISLCQALALWDPWSVPSAEVLHAMHSVQRHRDTPGAVPSDMGRMCVQRAEAITALAYEEAYSHTLPDSLRYQRLVRIRLAGYSWHRCAKDRTVTHKYLGVCAGIRSVASLTRMLEEANCTRHEQSHIPGNRICCGVAAFTANMVYNWRVLWWSLPWVSRKERLLHFCRSSLMAHRATGLPDERWRLQYTFLGQNVCRDAFLTLSGMGCAMIQAARTSALANKATWSPPSERGLHGGAMKNHGKPAAYLGARQWLEWYASSHAEWSPMDSKAYLPAGRKVFYYYHYRKDMLERYGLTEEDVGKEKARRQQKRRRSSELTEVAPRESTDARAYALASTRAADAPWAELDCFLRAWRIECPWLVVCKSVSMFTRCSVCEYLRLLIDQTPRDQESMRQALKNRLGSHFDFQAAQRMAHNRIEEECEQSGGQKWFMLIDKMDQKKTVCPTIWSQLSTKLFQDLEKRLITGLIGSMWFGTRCTTHHVRTVFNDCSHGSEMQCSTILLNLHEVATREGHLPKVFIIGADNTRKETKNQYCMWFLAWLLCALSDTPLWSIEVVFLMVGHTHNKLDRMFSRISVALRGRDYFTVVAMLRKIREILRYCTLHAGHLAQVWRWKAIIENPMPGGTRGMHNLDPAHAFKFTRDNGICMQWKQWCTDEAWSRPVQIILAEEVRHVAAWRPVREIMEFPNGGQGILDWIGRLEAWCAGQPQGTAYQGLDLEFQWLRAAVRHQVPGDYAPGAEVEDLLRDLRGLPHAGPRAYAPGPQVGDFPQDVIAQMFPGGDVPNIPHENLVRIDNVTHTAAGAVMRPNTIYPGSLVVIAAPEGTIAHDLPVPIAVGMVVEASSTKDMLVVAWYVPALARTENYRGGKKRMVLDVFGPWVPRNEVSVQVIKQCRHPSPLVRVQSILECNFLLSSDGALPYDVFDALRTRHNIDLTGFNSSMTQRGNMYRSYVLMGRA